MRVLHVTDEYGSTDGIRSYLTHLSDGLAEMGVDSVLYSPPAGHGSSGDVISGFLSLKHYRAVKGMMERHRPDILHAHSMTMRLSPSPLLAAARLGIPAVMTVHDFNYVCPRKWMIRAGGDICSSGFGLRCLVSNCQANRNGWRYLLYHDLRWAKIALHRPIVRRHVAVFICPSAALSQWMRKSLRSDNIVHIPNFVPRPPAAPLPVPTPKQMLFVGRLSREKGVDCLLRSMPLILAAHPDTSLTVVGEGPEKARLESLSTALGLSDHVTFAGEVSPMDLPPYYAKCSVSVVPSAWMENCPMAVLESLSFGRPLVGSNIGGIPELVQDGITGLLHERGSHQDLAAKISRLLDDQALLGDMGRNAFDLFQRSLSEEAHLERICALYREVRRS